MPARPESYVYKVAEGCRIKADLYRAAADQRDAPAILWLHGGALIWGTRWWIGKVQLRHYLAHGVSVIAADYRLAPETKLPSIVEDLGDAWRWVRSECPRLCGINPDRVGVVGHSAGGYLTLMAGMLIPPPQALVSFYGYGDLVAPWYSAPDPHYSQLPAVSREAALAVVGTKPLSTSASNKRFPFYLYCRQQGVWPLEVGGHDPATDPGFFTPYCPAYNVGPSYPPTLLLHGDADTDVPYEQSVQMAAALARAGVEHRLITVPGGGHGFDGRLSDAAAGSAFGEALDFLSRHL